MASPVLSVNPGTGTGAGDEQPAATTIAAAPTVAFDSATDQRLIAVLTLANLESGTKISYTRYIDNKYVNSKAAVLKKRAKFFHFTFKPKAGGTFTPGNYRMKFYVNEKAAGEISFAVK